jgi:glycosyltransferase involved in cell wall biosynthesis
MANKPKYSICVPNFNMADTLEVALESVLRQIDDDYEVLVVDDGSSDNSLDILKEMAAKYAQLRVISLARNRKRKLGQTRNISVEEAKGEYVILHIDADDYWEPHIKDFVAVFHKVEKCVGLDLLVSGQQLNIAKRKLLLAYGPYRNTHRLQDRDMWTRLAADDRYLRLLHRVFWKRIGRKRRTIFFKSISNTWYRMNYELRSSNEPLIYAYENLTAPIFKRTDRRTFRNRVGRMVMTLPAFILSRFDEPLPLPENLPSQMAFSIKRDSEGGTYSQIMKNNNCNPALDFLDKKGREVFTQGPEFREEKLTN